jgi:hypothetical protein
MAPAAESGVISRTPCTGLLHKLTVGLPSSWGLSTLLFYLLPPSRELLTSKASATTGSRDLAQEANGFPVGKRSVLKFRNHRPVIPHSTLIILNTQNLKGSAQGTRTLPVLGNPLSDQRHLLKKEAEGFDGSPRLTFANDHICVYEASALQGPHPRRWPLEPHLGQTPQFWHAGAHAAT